MHRAATNIALFQFPKLITIRIGLIHLSQRDVHEVVTVDEMSVESLAVLEFDQLRTCRVNQADSWCGRGGRLGV